MIGVCGIALICFATLLIVFCCVALIAEKRSRHYFDAYLALLPNYVARPLLESELIPKKLYLCYKSKKQIPEFALKEWAMLNPEFQIETFGDVEIIEFLQKEFGSATVNAFKNIKHGPIKADFFRFHILYKRGGVYCDVDIEPLVPLKNIVDFSSDTLCVAQSCCFPTTVNPCILASSKHNLILEDCINCYEYLFDSKTPYSYWAYSSVAIMTKVLSAYLDVDNNAKVKSVLGHKIRCLRERSSKFLNISMGENAWIEFQPNKPLLNSRRASYNRWSHEFK